MLRARMSTLMICFFMAAAVNAGAAEEKAHLLKDNALSIKAGYHLYSDSDFMDFWNLDRIDFNGFIGEVAYERRLYKNLWLEVALGFYQSGEEYTGARLAGDYMDLTISNAYFSPTLKAVVPLSDFFIVHAGVGPDYCYTQSRLRYRAGGLIYDRDENFSSFGAHGLLGIEFYVMRRPADFGFWDAPVGIFFEYKYTWLPVKDFDEGLINVLNDSYGTSYGSHEADVGGSTFLGGIRWHF
ncbi:MAG TPA: hypothetical protein P5551_05750 [Syntrophales bacterium]|nr:hypothetical protein [Syntrophales bacterium]HRT61847.1 hypothetical protein [Syntrophales bacterium]